METRELFLLFIYGIPLIGMGLSFWGWLELRSFLKAHVTISTERDLDSFKRLVKLNMILAVGLIALAVQFLVIGAAGIYIHALEFLRDGVVFFVIGPPYAIGGFIVTAVEKRVKATPVENEALRDEVQQVLMRWEKNVFPDW